MDFSNLRVENDVMLRENFCQRRINDFVFKITEYSMGIKLTNALNYYILHIT
jgi:hypothetical protein